ncbi:aldehyde-activating protein [Gemmobacter aquaticus]|uniref:aldehyde-activating protein n=1 Tax=Gemmobacter aquaticus TaxID=490185 RepID=UPI0011B43D76|nr:aldehyde-activating protein [Gemmobacter aquaticus]
MRSYRGSEQIDHDVRCATCGSYLFSVVRNGAFVHVSYGSLIDLPSMLSMEHIHVASKAPWYSI